MEVSLTKILCGIPNSLFLPIFGGFMHSCVSIISKAFFIFYFVDLMPFCCLFMCPLSVAGHDSGRYFSTASAVRPGHVVNWLFLIALRRVDLVGQNKL